MSLDPVRAERVRRMVLRPSTWPTPYYICMKRIESGQIVEFGRIYAKDLLGASSLDVTGENGTDHKFDDVEALIAAGWAVD